MALTFDLKVDWRAHLQLRLQHAHHASEDGAMATTVPPARSTTVGGGLVVVGATFHYLGPSFAVLLFVHLDVLGVAWLRMATAALVLALVRPPWTVWRAAGRDERVLVVSLGIVLAAMNATFYLALDRLPLATVAGIEFLGVIALAAYGARTRRNAMALGLTVAGVALLTQVRIAGTPVGLVLAAANCLGFMLYIVIGHRLANVPSSSRTAPLDRLSLVVAVGAVAATPLGIGAAWPATQHPTWLLWGLGVGVCSTVIPYLTDQLAMVRLPRATYSLMLALLPVTATVCGVALLHQLPGRQDLAGLALVVAGVAAHRPPPGGTREGEPCVDQERSRLLTASGENSWSTTSRVSPTTAASSPSVPSCSAMCRVARGSADR
jgi:inner membrane transporter RhtA